VGKDFVEDKGIDCSSHDALVQEPQKVAEKMAEPVVVVDLEKKLIVLTWLHKMDIDYAFINVKRNETVAEVVQKILREQ
jgi:hypothetical protein